MVVWYTPANLMLMVFAFVALLLVVPPALGGVTVVTVGDYRLWFTSKGWSFQAHMSEAGIGRLSIENGISFSRSLYWSKGGMWPWYREQK